MKQHERALWNRGCAVEARRLFLGAAALCLLAGWPWPGMAGEEGRGEEGSEQEVVEPILTEETLPNSKGGVSLRLTTDYRRSGGEAEGVLPKVELFYGLADRWGAELSLPLAYRRGDDRTRYGLGDASLGLKYLTVKHSSVSFWPAVVVGLEATFPTGDDDRELGEGAFEVEPFVALLRDFGRFSLQGNFGWSKALNRGHDDRFTYSWALALPLIARAVHVLAEINGDWGREPQSAAAPGIKYNLSPEMFVGAAVPLGLNRHTPDWGIVTQFQIGF